MPTRWTPETDQILLLKILETSQINADVKAIAAAWPTTLDMPTPRAISERLVKIRSMAKENGAASTFSVSSGKTSAPTTPRKRAAKPATPKKAPGSGVKKATAAGAKRKRGGKFEKSSSDVGSDDSQAEGIKDEPLNQDDDEFETPISKKKVKAEPKEDSDDAHESGVDNADANEEDFPIGSI